LRPLLPSDQHHAQGAGRPDEVRKGRARRGIAAGLGVAAAAALSLGVFAGASNGSTVGAQADAAAASIPGLYGSLPPVGKPSKGGTITVGQLTGSTPTDIFPMIADANASIYEESFLYNLFLPLYNGPNGATPEINYAVSLATAPVFSDGDKTVTIQMKQNFKWSNGQPVDANDLVFAVDVILAGVNESAANWSAFTPGQFPQSLSSIKATGKYTVVMHLKRAFNPSYFLNDQLQGAVFPMPSTAWNIASPGGPHLNYNIPANAKKIYDYLSKAGGQIGSFTTNPLWKIVDGPFALTSFSSTNRSFDEKANPSFGGSPKPSISALDTETFTGITPQLNALRTGGVDIAGVDFSQLGEVSSLRSAGYSVFGWPDLGWFAAVLNFKDTTDHFNSIVSQLYFRQALAELVNQPAYLTGIFKNAGGLSYGPVPALPPTPYTPADALKAPYPFSPSAAVALLKSHGWKVVPNGQTTCAKAGSGAGECGAGIPAGTPIKFTWFSIPVSSTPSSSLESESFAAEAKEAAGIDVELETKTFNYLVSNFDDANPSDAKYDNAWGVNNDGGFTDDYYPTSSSIFNTGGDYNDGAYDSPIANGLINDSVYGSNPKAVTNEASFLTQNLPALFMPNSDLIWAVSNKVGGPASSFISLTQYIGFPQYWYLNK
jgi:peptide/nickel transport system substrate-binding protein